MSRPTAEQPEQRYSVRRSERRIVRFIARESGQVTRSTLPVDDPAGLNGDLHSSYDQSWLSLSAPPRFGTRGDPIDIVDLFSGCGAMTLGALEAGRALGLRPGSIVGCDSDADAIAVFARNFPRAATLTRPLEEVFSKSGATANLAEITFKRAIGGCDLLLGGPPCQGHSDLNNHTRRADPRNALMLVMLRAAEVLKPAHIIIENVRGILHDEGRVVEKVLRGLERIGYSVDHGIIKLEEIGVPQLRHRFVLVGSREKSVGLDKMVAGMESPRTVAWACGDVQSDDSLMGKPSSMSKRNQERVKVLFDRDIYDLPDKHRPPCHRDGKHSYKSVYGRLRWDEPSQTITTGFGSMGQGRFVHPEQLRTLTPREAARLQFIPDFFDFGSASRTHVARMIGNAVPPKLSYVLALALLS